MKIGSWGKKNCNFDLEAILGKVTVSTLMLEIEPTLVELLMCNILAQCIAILYVSFC